MADSYKFGPFSLDVRERLLLCDGETVPLAPKVFDLLLVLVTNSGHLVEKDYLMQMLWPDSFVGEGSLAQNVFQLRKTLAGAASEGRYIETIPKRGYRFVAAVTEVRSDSGDSSEQHSARASVPAEVAGTSQVKTLAVLPFRVLGAEGDDELLGSGMAAAICVKLDGLRQITVIPTSACLTYAGRGRDSFAAGRKLGADGVLDGTAQLSGPRLRVTVQLINLHQRRTLWSGTFDEQFTDVFAAQDAISEQVTQGLALHLANDQKRPLTKRHTERTEAYQSYLMGLHLSEKVTRQGLSKAVEYFRQAIAKDPDYAPAYAGLADSYFVIIDREYAKSSQPLFYEDVKAAALRALELDESNAEAHTALAVVKIKFDRDPLGAERTFERAIVLDPTCALAHLRYTWFLAAMGRLDESLQQIKRAQELDPLSPSTNIGLGLILYFLRDHAESIRYCQRALTIEPNFSHAMLCLGLNYEQTGAHEEAIAEYRKAGVVCDDSTEPLELLGHALAVGGRRGEALKVLSEINSSVERRSASLHNIALIHAALGQKEQAFKWLEKRYANRTDRVRHLRFDPRFDILRSDRRYKELLRRSILAIQTYP